MKFIRAELHNHSTESDGALSVETLAAYAAEKNFGVLALTDHNTTSGHAKAYDAIRRAGYALALLPGVEITTFFGHILALGLVQMPDITTLDPRAPEPFFAMLRTAGARAVGIAHPFSVGSPLFIGCPTGTQWTISRSLTPLFRNPAWVRTPWQRRSSATAGRWRCGNGWC